MEHKGGCHCGRIAFKVEAEIKDVIACNCSLCAMRGSLLFAVPRSAISLDNPQATMSAYEFNTHRIRHYFCPVCGVAPFSEGAGRDDAPMAMVNARTIEGIDLDALNVVPYDGRSR